MAQGGSLKVKNYRTFMRAIARTDKDSRKAVRAVLKSVGEVVQRDAVRRMSPINSRSAAGYRVRVRQRGVAVEQSLRKTTGAHPEFGSLQMRRVLIPARSANAREVEQQMERAFDLIADHFNERSNVT